LMAFGESYLYRDNIGTAKINNKNSEVDVMLKTVEHKMRK